MNPQMDQRADRPKTERRDTYRDNCRFQSPMLIKRKTNFPSFFVPIVVTNYYEVIAMKYVLTTCGLTTAPNSSLSTILTAHEKSKLLFSNSYHPSKARCDSQNKQPHHGGKTNPPRVQWITQPVAKLP